MMIIGDFIVLVLVVGVGFVGLMIVFSFVWFGVDVFVIIKYVGIVNSL